MVEILDSIPVKKAKIVVVPKEKPLITGYPGWEKIQYDSLTIPEKLNRKFLNRCGVDLGVSAERLSKSDVEDMAYQANLRKDIMIRYAGENPLSVVTDQFREIHPAELVEHAHKIIGSEPVIRYFSSNESVQINFPINTQFKGMHLVMNTGSYGVYGGSGRDAIKFGISWFNQVCMNWTLFLGNALKNFKGRIVHRGNEPLESKLSRILSLVGDIGEKIDSSRYNHFTYPELDAYLTKYENKGMNKGYAKILREENQLGMSAYDLSYRLTELCQAEKLADSTRARMEYLAGELILCFDEIKQGLVTMHDIRKTARHGFSREIPYMNHYVRLNQ